MTIEEVIKAFKEKPNGKFFRIQYQKDLTDKIKASERNSHELYKITDATVRKGVSYSNKKDVEPSSNKRELPWGEWSTEEEHMTNGKSFVIKHKGELYIRVEMNNSDGIDKAHTKYFLDGVEVTYDELKNSGIMIDSFFKPKTTKDTNSLTQAVNVKNITNVL